MIDKRYIELMNKEIDGTNTPEESRKLSTYLKRSAKGQRYYKELCALAQLFNRAEEVDPPEGLRKSILSSIQFEKTAGRGNIFSLILGPLAGIVRGRFFLRYACVFSTGVIAGACLFVLLFHISTPEDRKLIENLYGTITIGEEDEDVLIHEPIEFKLAEVSGFARFKFSTDRVFAEVNIAAEEAVDVVFEYGDKVLFEGIRALDGAEQELKVANNRMELKQLGVSNYVIVFKNKVQSHHPINMKILSDGTLLFERTVVPGRE